MRRGPKREVVAADSMAGGRGAGVLETEAAAEFSGGSSSSGSGSSGSSRDNQCQMRQPRVCGRGDWPVGRAVGKAGQGEYSWDSGESRGLSRSRTHNYHLSSGQSNEGLRKQQTLCHISASSNVIWKPSLSRA